MSDNPYFIRLELLKLAQSIASDAAWVERNRLEQDWNSMKDYAIANDKAPPPFPEFNEVTTDQVLEIANQLNDFISNNK